MNLGLIAFTVILMAGLRWAILPRVTTGSYSIHSGFYARKWTVSLATEVTLETLSSLFATIYMRAWYRLMGAQIGRAQGQRRLWRQPPRHAGGARGSQAVGAGYQRPGRRAWS